MRISKIAIETEADGARLSARLDWEDAERPPFDLEIATHGAPPMADDQAGNALLVAAFPIAFHDRERRLAIEAPVCPMLADNMATVLACWNEWEEHAPRLMTIETGRAPPPQVDRAAATGFLSGGVDSLHLLQHNRRIHSRGEPAWIERLVLIHGFDIGKRKNDEAALFELVRGRIGAVAADTGARLATCSSNLRKIRLTTGFWTNRFYGAAVLAMGHAVAPGVGYLNLAGTYDFPNLVPIGSSPIVDVLLSSQRLQVVHEGLRFSRLAKLRDLATWDLAIKNLRVCAHEGRTTLNCGACEKCVRTRLGLLAVGREHSAAFGNHLVSAADLDVIELTTDYHVACYREIAAALARGPHADLARVITERIGAAATDNERHATT